jgi:hypothetical protein
LGIENGPFVAFRKMIVLLMPKLGYLWNNPDHSRIQYHEATHAGGLTPLERTMPPHVLCLSVSVTIREEMSVLWVLLHIVSAGSAG